ncbi:uncharacterized protein AB675_2435 [Cyphellophora attinorum]|uniref:Glyoxalase/fosfomycin resistance/dioxygenase domain-containing protein n=1 Tax=Cyphellophora attinorum TaxID=1664694 RepID=A0A0N1HX00_9EURO|nr:uncharacterized protein AB675_2435 [Phialophora attinorum]KPI44914.1 hypothetical protein AB675_2435 [Phialophora attinorum]
MSTSYQHTVFLNLPVASLADSIAFYTALGFVQNHNFSSPAAAQMSLPSTPTSPTSGPEAHTGVFKLMLLTHDFYRTFLPPGHSIPDPKKVAQQILCISRESREAVDEFLKAVEENGGKRDVRPESEMDRVMKAQGFYGGNAMDPDGHLIECVFMPSEMYAGKE